MTEGVIKIGSTIEYRASFGFGPYKTAEIVAIEKVFPGQKEGGVDVAEISWDEKEGAVFDLSDSHWCYGDQIESVLDACCAYCGEDFNTMEDRDKCDCKEAVKARRIDYEMDQADAKRKSED